MPTFPRDRRGAARVQLRLQQVDVLPAQVNDGARRTPHATKKRPHMATPHLAVVLDSTAFFQVLCFSAFAIGRAMDRRTSPCDFDPTVRALGCPKKNTQCHKVVMRLGLHGCLPYNGDHGLSCRSCPFTPRPSPGQEDARALTRGGHALLWRRSKMEAAARDGKSRWPPVMAREAAS